MTAGKIYTKSFVFRFSLYWGWFLVCLFVGTSFGQDKKEPQESEKIETHELNRGFYYTVKKGDTLWDLSQRFYDSPWVWPDLWEKNRTLSNPHWIYPGEQLRLYSRDAMESSRQTKADQRGEGIKDKLSKYYFYPGIDGVGFVKKEPVSPAGEIFKVRVNKEIIGEADVVYIRPNTGTSFEVGQRFTVYRTTEAFKDERSKSLIGIQHYIVGLVDVFEVYDGIATASVYISYRNIEADDLVMPFEPRSARIEIVPSADDIRGTVFGLEEAAHNFGDHTIVFVNKGRQDGIQIGQFYNLIHQEDYEFTTDEETESFSLAPVHQGKLLILHVEDNASTALVTAVSDVVSPGIEIRTP